MQGWPNFWGQTLLSPAQTPDCRGSWRGVVESQVILRTTAQEPMGTGSAAAVYHFQGQSAVAHTFASRCLQGPVSGPRTQARPQVGTKVVLASHPCGISCCQRHPDPLSISSSCMLLSPLTSLSPHSGFLAVEQALPRNHEGIGLRLGQLLQR